MIGPYRLKFDRRVGRALRNGLTPDEKKCIEKFFSDIQSTAVSNEHCSDSSRRYFLIWACGHIVELQETTQKQAFIENIYRSPIAKLADDDRRTS
jgi:hypothetical protein